MAATTAAVVGAGAAAYGASKSGKAAEGAADTQAAASEAGIAEQRRQFDEIAKLLGPFVSGGTAAFTAQQDLLGLKGPERQRDVINQLQWNPTFQALAAQGENALLQNASATGGLRGGNIQGALAQFRPQLLNQQIQQQLANLGGLSSIGQASAAQQAVASGNTASNVSTLLGQQGAALAGGQLARANATQQGISDILKIGAAAYGAGAF